MESTEKPKGGRKVLKPKPLLEGDALKPKPLPVEDSPKPVEEDAPKKTRRVMKPKPLPEEDSPKTVSIELPSPLLSTPTVVERVEAQMPQLIVQECQKVHLKRFELGGKFYYRNSETDELYEYLGAKKRGLYCGRYDCMRGCIVKDAPESDYED
jgi:hypothetical protein